MTDGEKKLLMALVAMVHQHLHANGDQVDNLAVSAGERAICVFRKNWTAISLTKGQ